MSDLNLFPPVIATSMPAFLFKSKDSTQSADPAHQIVRLYFSLSILNTEDQISTVQLLLTRQDNNNTALNKELWPNNIAIKKMHYDSAKQQYYIEILDEDLIYLSSKKLHCFEAYSVYKTQIRFTSTSASSIPKEDGRYKPTASWFSKNLDNFSEWSSVCLLFPITSPNVTYSIQGFSDNVLHYPMFHITGRVDFGEGFETLKQYQLILKKKKADGTFSTVETSDIILSDKYNNAGQFEYEFETRLDNGATYQALMHYWSRNDYEAIVTTATNALVSYNSGENEMVFTYKLSEEEGLIRLSIKCDDIKGSVQKGTVELRRASFKDNFKKWKSLTSFKIEETKTGQIFNYNDITVEPGVLYKYELFLTSENEGIYSYDSYIDNTPQMIGFEHMYLANQKQQLKIAYDPDIASFAYHVSESRNDTIGGKYSFIKRNGATKYASFPISGVIYSAMDENALFTSKAKLYGDYTLAFEDYNAKFQIDANNDIIYEKYFREAVMDFIYADEPKIFKSPTEGNFIVRLMDISFTPNKTLGRFIYNFSCTAYEIDEYSIENLKKYKLIGDSLTSQDIAIESPASKSVMRHTKSEPNLNKQGVK